ncbi:MAG: isoprenylcysteine carboxylmethyltransferase family protein [Gemmatimonadaceae bacterium]
MEQDTSRGPGVRIHPPILYLTPLLLGYIVQHFMPIHIVTGARPARILDVVGAAEIFIGVSLATWAVATLRRLKTPIVPVRPASTLAAEGPFTLTRNPIYLSFSLIYLGITFVTNAFWPLLFLPEAMVLTYLLAIKPEEAHLAREFGDAYTEYCKRVRRWV